MGRVYLPKLKHSGEESSIWWVDYYHAGKRVRESSGFTAKKQAEELLKVREGRAASGEPVLPKAAKTTFEEVVTDLVAYYTSTGTRELGEAEGRLRHLRAHFAGWRAVGIDRAAITAYIVARQGQGAAAGLLRGSPVRGGPPAPARGSPDRLRRDAHLRLEEG